MNLVHTKPLTIKRSASSFVKNSVLINPAFTAELASRMTISYATDIQAVDKKDSVIYKTIHSHLEKYPDYVALSEYQKDELYKNIL